MHAVTRKAIFQRAVHAVGVVQADVAADDVNRGAEWWMEAWAAVSTVVDETADTGRLPKAVVVRAVEAGSGQMLRPQCFACDEYEYTAMNCPHNVAAIPLGRVDPVSTASVGNNGGDNGGTGGTDVTDTSNSAADCRTPRRHF